MSGWEVLGLALGWDGRAKCSPGLLRGRSPAAPDFPILLGIVARACLCYRDGCVAGTLLPAFFTCFQGPSS